MSNIFTTNPIRVNIISINNTIKQTLLFIGIVPNDVKQELIKIEKNRGKNIPDKNKILYNFYGKLWHIKLGLRNQIKGGGDEFSFDDDIDDIPDQIDEKQDIPDQIDEKQDQEKLDIKEKPSLEPDGVISIDELMGPTDEVIPQDFVKIAQITKTETETDGVRFVFSDPFLSVYPEDNILEFKKKLYVVAGIPIYRQHMWYVYQ